VDGSQSINGMTHGRLAMAHLQNDAIPDGILDVSRDGWGGLGSEEIKRPPFESIRGDIVNERDGQRSRILLRTELSGRNVAIAFSAGARAAATSRLCFVTLYPTNLARETAC
jgi:hypothetical protein